MDEIEQVTPTTATTIRTQIGYVFVGKDGLRAGWSILLFFVFVAIMSFVLYYLVHPPKPKPDQGMVAGSTALNEAIPFAILCIAAFVMSLIERRPFSSYGIRSTNILPDFMKGLAWGLAMLSVLIALLYVTGALVFDGIALAAGPALLYAGKWLVAFVLVGFLEEFMFRGYLQFTLARGVTGIIRAISPDSRNAATIGFWVAATVFSVILFALVHTSNGGETAQGIIAVALAGLVFVFSLWWTGSLWWAIGFHATWDWAQSYLYGVADSGLVATGHLLVTHPVGAATLSGGTTGPEGSILVVPVLLLSAVAVWKTMPRRPAPGTEERRRAL